MDSRNLAMIKPGLSGGFSGKRQLDPPDRITGRPNHGALGRPDPVKRFAFVRPRS